MSRLMIFYISSQVKIQSISSTPQCAFGSQFSQHPGREVTILLSSITVEAWLDLELHIMESYWMNSLVSDLFFSTLYLWESFMCLSVATVYSCCIVFHYMISQMYYNLFIYSIVKGQFDSYFSLLWKSWHRHFCTFLWMMYAFASLGTHIEVDVLGRTIGLCLAFIA